MRLAEEEKLRKEMSAKKAKEEAERKHQVSRECPSPSMSLHWLPISVLATPFLPLCPELVLGQDKGQRAVAQSARVHALRSSFSGGETTPR